MSFTKELNDWFGVCLLISDIRESKLSSDSEKWKQLIESKTRNWFITNKATSSKLQINQYREITQLLSVDDFMIWINEIEHDSELNESDKWSTVLRYIQCNTVVHEAKKGGDETKTTNDLPLIDIIVLSWLLDSLQKNQYELQKTYMYVCKSANHNSRFLNFIKRYQKWKLPLKARWFRMFDALQVEIQTITMLINPTLMLCKQLPCKCVEQRSTKIIWSLLNALYKTKITQLVLDVNRLISEYACEYPVWQRMTKSHKGNSTNGMCPIIQDDAKRVIFIRDITNQKEVNNRVRCSVPLKLFSCGVLDVEIIMNCKFRYKGLSFQIGIQQSKGSPLFLEMDQNWLIAINRKIHYKELKNDYPDYIHPILFRFMISYVTGQVRVIVTGQPGTMTMDMGVLQNIKGDNFLYVIPNNYGSDMKIIVSLK